ncbi:TAP-like protein-domain-containing protein [Podospora australis]|uniref:TAP-like protein-domain-containing protein n=1 Tax=Podospora australis TaxID=1536484 RepID=A0AAN6WJF9_9PEZI|nr:TAP-like protein-domain-containing protein [Podospora australis]
MTLLRPLTVLCSLLAATTLAKPLYKPRTQSIQWGPCDLPSLNTRPIECGSILVPLDYTNPFSNETLKLALIKSPAVVPLSPKKSILFNFGGPGYEAMQTLNGIADTLHNMTGGRHDLIAFDPRGTANTLRFTCFANQTERTLANAKYPLLAASSEGDLTRIVANSHAVSNLCAEAHAPNDLTTRPSIPTLIGTSFVARDLMQVVDALGEDGLLRFWGISYGSLLGATAAAMFPARISRLVLDGVVNAHNYYHHAGVDITQLLSTDSAFRAILASCLSAGPSRCALASLNSTSAADLEKTLLDLAESFSRQPLVTSNPTGIITKSLLLELYFIIVKYPSGVIPTAFSLFYDLLQDRTDHPERVNNLYNALQGSVSTGDNDALLGILCADKGYDKVATSADDIREDFTAMRETTALFGDIAGAVVTMCAGWKFRAKERFQGFATDVTATTKKIKTKEAAVLFVGNTYDPVTPVVSAKNMSGWFEGSVVLERNGFGHASIAQRSDCTTGIFREYFVNGTLPRQGTVCEVDESLF